MEEHSVTYRREAEGYGVIQLNRPAKRNAISNEMAKKLKAYINEAKADDLKFLVLTGSGDMFCSGGDLNDLHGDLTSDAAFSYLYPMKELLFDILSFPVPTICLLNGNALGGGCELATACDFRIAKNGTSFGFIQASIGIVPGWGGGTLLYEKVHPSFAYQWLVEAKVFKAEVLYEKGWIHRIEHTDTWKNELSLLKSHIEKTHEQMKMLKSQYKKSLSTLRLSSQMSEEVRSCSLLWESDAHKEALRRFFNEK